MDSIRINRKSFLYPLVLLVLLLAGCASGGIFGGGDDNDDNGYDDDYDRGARITEVRGRVERVDTADAIIWVEPSGVYRNQLRNDDDQIALHYDDSTEVEYDGKTYEPRALEVGDRIVARVDDTGSRLYARDIEVTYDVTANDRSDDDRYDDDREADDDRYGRDDDRYDRDDDRYDRDNDTDVAEVRGKVRWLDEDRKVLEIEDASWGWSASRDRDRDDDVIEVHYDSNTVVEYRGKRYAPENLERGDEIQVEVRDLGSRYLADEILVLASVSD
jgi:hypothetical protein